MKPDTTVRESIVRHLMNIVSDAMTDEIQALQDVTANEVFSTYLTLTRATIIAAKALGTPSASLQRAVEQLLLDCLDAKTTVN